jgi:hypothetical protein
LVTVMSQRAIASPMVGMHGADVGRGVSPARSSSREDAEDAAGAVDVFHVDVCVAGATLQRFGTLRLSRSMSSMVKSTSPSWAMASRCSTVLVEPPMAMSSAHGVLERLEGGDAAGETDLSSSS